MILDSEVKHVERQEELLRRHWRSATETFVEFPRAAVERPIAERIEYIAEQYAERPALQSHDATLTFAELNRSANRLAHAVNARLGDGNEPVVLLFERSAMAIVAMFGMLKARKIYVALDPQSPADRLNSFIADSQARLILTNRRNLALAEELVRQASPNDFPQILTVEEVGSEAMDGNLNLPISPDDYASIIYTSGSTGQPKGAIQSQRSILHFAMMRANQYRICPQDRQGQFFSYSYSGMFSSVFPMLLSGALLIPIELETIGIRNLADWIVQNEVTILHLTPQVHRQFFDGLPNRDPNRFPRVRILAIGGGLLRAQDVTGWLAHLSLDCVISYSLASTEALAVTRFFIDSKTPLPFDTLPVGYPEPDKGVRLMDDAGRVVGSGEVGEIVVRSYYLIPGYWRKPELTATFFKPDPEGSDARLFFTGDLARERADGLIEMVGRKDFQIKIRGFTIQPGEVEMALYDLGGIKETVVVAAASEDGNPRLAAYIVTKSQPSPTVNELRARLKAKLPESSVPSTFVFLDALPHTVNGKIDRAALPKPGSARPNLAQPYAAACDAL
ncbi:MAG TPA: amino acid adenylation domain-containing protein, partial [Anaerolineae bacterium]